MLPTMPATLSVIALTAVAAVSSDTSVSLPIMNMTSSSNAVVRDCAWRIRPSRRRNVVPITTPRTMYSTYCMTRAAYDVRAIRLNF